MSFETFFITEGPDASPAAEIQFSGQRLCIVRIVAGQSRLEFIQDQYVGRKVAFEFSLAEFQERVNVAAAELCTWAQRVREA